MSEDLGDSVKQAAGTSGSRTAKTSTRRLLRSLSPIRLLAGALLLLAAIILPGSALVRAQTNATDIFAVGTVVRVANTDGEPLNLRAGPTPDDTIVGRLVPDEAVTVVAAPRVSGSVRWIPVQTRGGQLGWVAEQYLAAPTVTAAAPSAAPSPTPEMVIAEAPALSASPEPMMATGQASGSTVAQAAPDGPLEVEVKVKYPEAKTKHQEVTIWVTRNGQPIENATVTMFLPDDEDQELKTLDPTDAEGRTYRSFTLARTKGSVSMVISAESPDGAKGRTEASYFVR